MASGGLGSHRLHLDRGRRTGVGRLGVASSLARTVRSTNTIESMIGICRDHCRNVKRWRDGSIAMRWCAASMVEARKQFRRVNGYLHLVKAPHRPRSPRRRDDLASLAREGGRIAHHSLGTVRLENPRRTGHPRVNSSDPVAISACSGLLWASQTLPGITRLCLLGTRSRPQ